MVAERFQIVLIAIISMLLFFSTSFAGEKSEVRRISDAEKKMFKCKSKGMITIESGWSVGRAQKAIPKRVLKVGGNAFILLNSDSGSGYTNATVLLEVFSCDFSEQEEIPAAQKDDKIPDKPK